MADKYISLAGGVNLTLKSSGNVYSISNFHGDTALTVDTTGNPTSSVYLYDPFGQTSPSSTFNTGGYNSTPKEPANSTNRSMTWAANPSRKAEASDLFTIPIIQMGVRVYLPTVGRFLQVDPIEGGTTNAYVYVVDPINDADYSGAKSSGWFTPFTFMPMLFSPASRRVTVAATQSTLKWAQAHPDQANVIIILLSEGRSRGVGRGGIGSGEDPVFARISPSTAAEELGYKTRIPAQKAPFNSHGQPVFQNGNKYITLDVDSHTGGTWKVFIKTGGQYVREGTYDSTLQNRLGD